MDATPAVPMFRPLGIGEIFDRAITIYTRNFAVFTLMVLTLLAPFAVIQYFATPDQSRSLSQAIDQIQHPTRKPDKEPDPLAGYTPAKVVGLLTVLLLLLALAPFVNNAVAVGFSAVYFGKRPDYRGSFAAVLRRWPAVLGTALLSLLMVFAAYFAGAIALVLLFAIGVLLAKPLLPLAILIFVLAAALVLAFVLLMMLMLVCYAFAIYSVSLEETGAVKAIGNALARIFNRQELGKALLMALAYLGIELGVLMVSGTVGALLLFVLRNTAIQLAVNAVVSSMLTSFLAILLAVYYYDVRTRREGLDLEADLQRLAG
jgi:hypothetical protein